MLQVFVVMELIVVVEVISRGEGDCGGEVLWPLGCMESLSLHREVWGFEMPLDPHWCIPIRCGE